jgi:hypothetical protein
MFDNRRPLVFGPGSGHEMHCEFCGYWGNSYYHRHCSGGTCHVCKWAHSHDKCYQCDRIICDECSLFEPILDETLCPNCSAVYRGQEIPKSKKRKCDCWDCERKREKERELKKIQDKTQRFLKRMGWDLLIKG